MADSNIIDLTIGDAPSSKKRKRSRKDSSSSHSRRPLIDPDDSELYFYDDVPNSFVQQTENPQEPDRLAESLLLPGHVSLIGDETALEPLPASSVDSSEEPYLEYLEYDSRDVPPVRYFEDPNLSGNSAVPTKVVCKNCGAENAHKTSQCPVIICYTCGARDEHLSRSCPISKICFSCGMKGHISASCPKPRHRNRMTALTCHRCGSGSHQTNECPTMWRLYLYYQQDECDQSLSARRKLKGLRLGHGGEGYISREMWCYNCGASGHWGDDCHRSFKHDRPSEPSGFSMHNLRSGPFYDPEKEDDDNPRHSRQEASSTVEEVDAWFAGMPDKVGSRGRRKDRDKLTRKEKTYEMDDEEDWFSRGAKSRTRSRRESPDRHAPKMSLSIKGAALAEKERGRERSSTSLLDRISSSRGSERANYQERERSPKTYDRGHSRQHRRQEDPPRKSSLKQPSTSRYGPKYNGAYYKK